jgi:hypothetical protein
VLLIDTHHEELSHEDRDDPSFIATSELWRLMLSD